MAQFHKAGFGLVVLLALFNSAQGASPEGSDYNIMVVPSFGGLFSDVIRFAAEGSLQVDGLGTGTWTAADYFFFDPFDAQVQDTASYVVNFEGLLYFRNNQWLIAIGMTPDNANCYWIVGWKASSPPPDNGPNTNWTQAPVKAPTATRVRRR